MQALRIGVRPRRLAGSACSPTPRSTPGSGRRRWSRWSSRSGCWPTTRPTRRPGELLDTVDVFVIPTVNPDGANYSFNDFNFQRKNLVNHCTGAPRDPRNADSWGVDVNRNYTVGSFFDGYVGAQRQLPVRHLLGHRPSCPRRRAATSIALAKAHPNIKFAMNVHSYGGYFMWPPGAYKADGRITLPRPSIDESTYFLDSARRIVGAIASERGTVTWPSYTGPVADVLYSAAGNSADQLYYELGIFAWDFEVGNDLLERGDPAVGGRRLPAAVRRGARRVPGVRRAAWSSWSGWPATSADGAVQP